MILRSRWFVGTTALMTAALLAQSAWSGKAERDRAAELGPKVASTKAAIQTACKCGQAMGVVVAFDSYKAVDDMAQISQLLDNLTSAFKGHCGTGPDRNAVCGRVTDVQINFTSSSTPPKLEGGGTLWAHSAQSFANSEGDFNKILDKL